MRTLRLFIVLGILCGIGNAQVKIGDNPQNLNPAAVLELESTTAALIITRVTTQQMEAIFPDQGALVYNIETQCVHYYDGAQWVNLCEGASIAITTDPIVNPISTIELTQTATGNNLEVAPNSIRSEQIIDGGIFGNDINDNSIGANKLARNAVGKIAMSENAVGPFAIDRDSLPLSFFINDVPFLTTGDIPNAVSGDADNVLVAGSDNGAFYNDQPLVDAIAVNTTAIANDLDGNPENELQNLSLNGNLLTLSDPVNGDDVIDLAGFTIGDSDPNDDIITRFEVVGANLVLTEGTTDFPVPLTDLGAGSGSTEVVDGTTLTGVGTVADPFKIEPSPTAGQFLTTNATGDVVWNDLPTGSGGTVNTDGTTITGDGDVTPLSVIDGGISPIKIEPSATLNQFLTTNATGDVEWVTVTPGSGSTEVVDGTTLTGVGTVADPFKIEPSPTAGQFLTTNATGDVEWVTVTPGGGTTEIADQVTIVGDGQAGNAFQVADGGITTSQIADGTIETVDIADATILAEDLDQMGATVDQVLKWDGTGWTPADDTDGVPQLTDGTILIGDATNVPQEQPVSGDAILTNLGVLTLTDDSVNATDLNPDVVGTGILQNAAGALEIDPTGITGDSDINSTDLVVGGAANALLENVTLELAPNEVNAVNLNADVAGNGLLQNAAGALEIDPTAITGDSDISSTDLVVGGTANALLENVTLELAPNEVNAVNLNADVAGNGLLQNAAGALEIDPTAITGDSDISSTDLVVGGDTNALLGSVTLELAANSVTSTEIADGQVQTVDIADNNVTVAKIDAGTDGQVLTTNGTDVVWSDASITNLADSDLTQVTGEDRTYNLNGQNLFFTGGSVGIGNLPGAPQNQLDVNGSIRTRGSFLATEGTAGSPGYAFYTNGDTDNGMYRPGTNRLGLSTNGTEAIRIGENQNVGIGNFLPVTTANPSSRLEVQGSFATAVSTTTADLVLNASHYTIILGGDHDITLPTASTCTGRLYIIKNITAFTPIISSYIDSLGTTQTVVAAGVTQLQSDGANWQQIN